MYKDMEQGTFGTATIFGTVRLFRENFLNFSQGPRAGKYYGAD